MAETAKRKRDADADEVQAQSVEEFEKEALGPKAPKEKKPKEPKEKKPMGKPAVAALTVLFCFAFFSLAILLVIYDFTEYKVIREWVFMRLDPESETYEQYWGGDVIDLQDWERDLDEWEQELEAFELELDMREEELDDWEDELDDRQTEIDDWLEIMRSTPGGGGGGAGGEFAPDIQHLARAVGRMEPSIAAITLSEMDFDSALRVIMLIGDKRLAPIFDAMDPEVMVDFWEAMSEEPDFDIDW
jgi:hypothetical protein